MGIWLILPAFTLLAFRNSPWQNSFRTQPFNNSYDDMFIAAAGGAGLTSVALLLSCSKQSKSGKQVALPLESSWYNAFDLFELLACASLSTLNFIGGAIASGAIWFVAFACLLSGTRSLRRAQMNGFFVDAPHSTIFARGASAFLIAFGSLFILFPVLQPWSGPPQPFVRWHPFSVLGELIWRGVFLCFAVGMFQTAFDPMGRHRPFMILLVISGYLHSGEMCVDTLLSKKMAGMNSNPQHLYGDVLGWFLIASISLSFLLLDRWSRHRRNADLT